MSRDQEMCHEFKNAHLIFLPFHYIYSGMMISKKLMVIYAANYTTDTNFLFLTSESGNSQSDLVMFCPQTLCFYMHKIKTLKVLLTSC